MKIQFLELKDHRAHVCLISDASGWQRLVGGKCFLL